MTAQYANQAKRPLACLLFLLPMVLAYEVGLFLLRTPLAPETGGGLAAPQLLQRFFSLFGFTGYYLPGAALVIILVVMHLVSRQPWQVRPTVMVGMAGESILWATPLIGLNQLPLLAGMTAAGRTWQEELLMSIGAGIYEELVFRLMVITLLMMLFVDVLRIRHGWSAAISIALSSLLFAAHHYPPIGTDVFQSHQFFFRMVAGWYLAGIFIFRGFGIAVGAHAMYNLIVITLL